jgi:transcriptional regulator with XRE-family HTH domain
MPRVPLSTMTGDELTARRASLGYTRTQLGKRLGFADPYNAIYRREIGVLPITARLARQILAIKRVLTQTP